MRGETPVVRMGDGVSHRIDSSPDTTADGPLIDRTEAPNLLPAGLGESAVALRAVPALLGRRSVYEGDGGLCELVAPRLPTVLPRFALGSLVAAAGEAGAGRIGEVIGWVAGAGAAA
jgi:hypothetical protein